MGGLVGQHTGTRTMKRKKDFKNNIYTARIRLTPEDLNWIKENKGKKTAAQFLREIIQDFKKPNLFKTK